MKTPAQDLKRKGLHKLLKFPQFYKNKVVANETTESFYITREAFYPMPM